ncbi:hypothetical protein [Cognatishimia sp. F0-27]|uniref:hypothetical protein n=1 Tax=Cognatishimia sp. F0-27 TaxID=2816855 RepID=UPI001D0C509B|nr:hypothetical protein [Cognatishimia sp. F0-27]MCC1494254.1 hypothetical protein [Cognatishimia sp. F0-27]
MILPVIAIALSVALSGLPADAQEYDGLYRIEGLGTGTCTYTGADDGVIEVRDGMLGGVESRCALTNPVAVRAMDATLFDAECMGEGETYGYRVMLMQTARGIAVIRNGYTGEYDRCGG